MITENLHGSKCLFMHLIQYLFIVTSLTFSGLLFEQTSIVISLLLFENVYVMWVEIFSLQHFLVLHPILFGLLFELFQYLVDS